MEFGGSGEHSAFNFIPKFDSGFSQPINNFINFIAKIFRGKSVLNNGLINGGDIQRQNHVKNETVSFHSVRNIVSSSSGVVHGTDIL